MKAFLFDLDASFNINQWIVQQPKASNIGNAVRLHLENVSRFHLECLQQRSTEIIPIMHINEICKLYDNTAYSADAGSNKLASSATSTILCLADAFLNGNQL